MSFLQIENKCFVVFGFANKKSVAAAVAKVLVEEGARVIHVVRSEERAEMARKLFPDSPVFLCDVEDEANIIRVREEIGRAVGEQEGGVLTVLSIPLPLPTIRKACNPFTVP